MPERDRADIWEILLPKSRRLTNCLAETALLLGGLARTKIN